MQIKRLPDPPQSHRIQGKRRDIDIEACVENRPTPSPGLEKLIGALVPPQENLFGEFERAHLMPAHRKFYARNIAHGLSQAELRTFHRSAVSIRPLHPRIPRQSNSKPDLAIYTDAPPLTRKIASSSPTSSVGNISIGLLAEELARRVRFRRFHRSNPTVGMEMFRR